MTIAGKTTGIFNMEKLNPTASASMLVAMESINSGQPRVDLTQHLDKNGQPHLVEPFPHQRERALEERLLVGPAGALHLQVVAIAEELAPGARRPVRLGDPAIA